MVVTWLLLALIFQVFTKFPEVLIHFKAASSYRYYFELFNFFMLYVSTQLEVRRVGGKMPL